MKLVCFAVKEEAPGFRKLAGPQSGVATLITGMGRHNAESAVRHFLTLQPAELVLTCGFAGGLDPNLAPGAVVFETTDEELADRLNQAGAKPAKIICADRVAVTGDAANNTFIAGNPIEFMLTITHVPLFASTWSCSHVLRSASPTSSSM